MNRRLALLLVATGALVLAAACSRQPDTTPALAPPATTVAPAPVATVAVAAVPAEPAITKDSPIWFEPEAMSSCAKGQTIVVHWNAASFPGVRTVKVNVPGEGDQEGTFAVAGVVGQKETGPWARGGGEFILRDAANDAELNRTRIPSLPCTE